MGGHICFSIHTAGSFNISIECLSQRDLAQSNCHHILCILPYLPYPLENIGWNMKICPRSWCPNLFRYQFSMPVTGKSVVLMLKLTILNAQIPVCEEHHNQSLPKTWESSTVQHDFRWIIPGFHDFHSIFEGKAKVSVNHQGLPGATIIPCTIQVSQWRAAHPLPMHQKPLLSMTSNTETSGRWVSKNLWES